jgi:hypothetical protein
MKDMQKSILILVVGVFLSFQGYAQITSKKVLLGGTAAFATNSYENSTNSSSYFQITPSVMYMLTNNLGLGVGIGYSQETADYQFNSTTVETRKRDNLSLNVYGRYYKAIGNSEFFYFFGQANIGIGTGNEETQSVNFTNKRQTTFWNVGLSPNFAFVPTKRWTIELGLSGISYQMTNPEGDNNNNSTFSFGLSSFSPNIGVRVLF